MQKSYLISSLLVMVACSGTTGSPLDGNGGSSNTAQGGNTSSDTGKGGQNTTPSNGGTNATGGSSERGGSNAGGSQSSGGTVSASGGTNNNTSTTSANKGGNPANGGSSAAGGAKPAGGTSSVSNGGSSVAKGGSSNPAGGAGPKGGSSASGGSVATAGSKPNGGSASGGVTSKGGTSSTIPAGGASNNVCKNLSAKPSATGKAKPSGTAGGLKVLDWAGFSSAISYTFDDSNKTQIDNYKAMNDAGGKYTYYLITGKAETKDASYKTALKDGHEMGNHTSDHQNCVGSDVDQGNSDIQSIFGVKAYAFAAPNGSTSCNTTTVGGKFLTNRSVAGGSVAVGATSGYTWLPSDIATTSNLAPSAGKWRVICIHGFTGGSDGAYQPIPLDSFTSAVKAAVSGGSWVETVTNVAAYNWGQSAISKSTSTSVTWTLPSVFPPNMCVRVTTSGGTVKQKGAEVPWDDHGYYEISLDAGSVTVE